MTKRTRMTQMYSKQCKHEIPYGFWTATLSGNTNTYYQQIAGVNQTFVSSGNSQTLDLKLQRVLSRSQADVFGMEMRLTKRFGASYIEDTEITQQRRDNTFVEAGLTDRHFFGSTQFDGSLAAGHRLARSDTRHVSADGRSHLSFQNGCA